MVLMWNLNDKSGSMKRPRNLIAGVLELEVTLSIGKIRSGKFSSSSLQLITILHSELEAMELLVKSINLVFCGCKHILWALKKCTTLRNSVLTVLIKISKFEFE
jgi:hypothetical protein